MIMFSVRSEAILYFDEKVLYFFARYFPQGHGKNIFKKVKFKFLKNK